MYTPTLEFPSPARAPIDDTDLCTEGQQRLPRQVGRDQSIPDVLKMSDSHAVWKEFLTVYTVKATAAQDAAQKVATMGYEQPEKSFDFFLLLFRKYTSNRPNHSVHH